MLITRDLTANAPRTPNRKEVVSYYAESRFNPDQSYHQAGASCNLLKLSVPNTSCTPICVMSGEGLIMRLQPGA